MIAKNYIILQKHMNFTGFQGKKIEKTFFDQQILTIKWSNDQNFKIYIFHACLIENGTCITTLPKFPDKKLVFKLKKEYIVASPFEGSNFLLHDQNNEGEDIYNLPIDGVTNIA